MGKRTAPKTVSHGIKKLYKGLFPWDKAAVLRAPSLAIKQQYRGLYQGVKWLYRVLSLWVKWLHGVLSPRVKWLY